MIFQRLGRLVAQYYRPNLNLKSTARKFSHPRKFLISAAAMSSYDWEKEKFSDAELVKYFKDIDFCSNLKLTTLTCEACGLRLKIDVDLPEISYCKCSSSGRKSPNPIVCSGDGWVPYVERKDILVWRKEHAHKKGLYHYKLYGVFNDVTVWEFLAVQLDLSQFRLGWDSSTAQCKQVDIQAKEKIIENPSDFLEDEIETPLQGVSNSSTLVLSNGCESNGSSEAMVYYWEVHWPTFFSNRDYCCLRQHLTDPTGRMVISSRTTKHAKCPLFKKNWRVQDYQSVMAVRPTVHPDKPGVEFTLTAFEDPGVALPESIISFITVRTMPEFMTNLRAACLKLRGAIGNAALPKPELFRTAALRTAEGLFELAGAEAALEESISKGDASYESAWIDKLLKDSDESGSESENNPVVARKTSLEIEAESIRKEPVVVFHNPVSLEKPLDSFNSCSDVKVETIDGSPLNFACQSLNDDVDERDAENNKFQEETLDLFKTEKLPAHKRSKAPKEDKLEALESINSSPMDVNTLNPIHVNDNEPKPDKSINPIKQSPVCSPMRKHLLLVDADVDQMSISSSSEQLSSQISSDSGSPEKPNSNSFLLGSEQIISSTGYIEYEMELLLYEENEISLQSTLLEHKLREVEGEGKECEDQLQIWFQLVTRKNMAFHRRLMLEIFQSEKDLEKRSELLQQELRRGDRGEVGEKLLLEELLKVVDMRDQLVLKKDKEERILQEEVMVGREVENKMTSANDIKKEKCNMQ